MKRSIYKGFGIIEIIFAVAIWAIFSGSALVLILSSLRSNRLADETNTATRFASEGLDAVDALKRQGWSSVFLGTNCVSGCGLATVSGTWSYSGTNNTFGKFTRTIFVTPVNRDINGNIVTSGGTVDNDTYKVESRVTWSRGIPPITDTISLVSYLTNYSKPNRKGGMLVYGDGGTTSDAIKYQTIDGSGTWSTPASTADVDTGTTNRALYEAKVYASATRNEKILISRHFDGSNQYIYGQVYNGTTWGNVQLLSSWSANTFLDVRNFDGTYLSDGSFMTVFSDNSTIPKMRTWNGSSWSAQTSLNDLGAAEVPTFIRISARPGTNEVMGGFFTNAKDVLTSYWSGSSWSANVMQANNAFNQGNQEMDFAWSPNTTTIGALIYMTAGGDKTPRAKLFQANGSGGGTWQAQVNGVNTAQAIRTMVITPKPNSDEFDVCYKDQQATPDLTCRKLTFSGTTLTWTTPTNPILTSTSVNGTGVPYSIGFEQSSGGEAVNYYSDNTNVPKIKKYTASTSTWDSSALSVSTSPNTLSAPVQTSETIPLSNTDDLMLLSADNAMDLYSVVWDGTNNNVYTTPSGQAFLQHGTNGSMITSLWYDFSWDNF